MYLVKIGLTGELSLTKRLIDVVPCYAILSHTWGEDGDEVTFQDLKSGTGQDKPGYRKIQFCAQQTKQDGLDHFWVDTCCIDKTNQNELNEAIASMFRWYHNASKCYVHLADVSIKKRKRDERDEVEPTWEAAFRDSRWFKRGWTLQELLAPKVVEFFSAEDKRLGDKRSLEQLIHEITLIPIRALQGALLSEFRIEERMCWAQKRETKWPEDRAYCLLGIFNVFIVPLYGERENAFVRLRDEIGNIDRSQEKDFIERMKSSNTNMNRDGDEMADRGKHALTLLESRDLLVASLAFEQMDSRLYNIRTADPATCRWLLQNVAYEEWTDHAKMDRHRGFLWIAGKPGAGKSTIMKYILKHATKDVATDEIIISFFFNARGHELEKSTTGMYRALLSQLLQKVPHLQVILDNVNFRRQPMSDSFWTVELLCELLLSVIARLGSRQLKCFIDALDECDEQEVQEMVHFCETLSENAAEHGLNLHICFASRHYPTIDIKHGLRLTLEDESGHTEDLVRYVQRHLRVGKGKLLEEIKQEICRKANGVFMWAILVVGILNDEFKRGRVFAVKKRLEEIPPELSNLFAVILRRDTVNMNELLLCLQWTLFAKRPLKREEFYFAMTIGLDETIEEVAPWDHAYVTTEDMDRFVLSSSKGLAELTKSKTPSVQFIHESVRDFLLKENGLHALWPEVGHDPYSSGHDRLKLCCEKYLNISSPSSDVSDPVFRKVGSNVNGTSGSISNGSKPDTADDSKLGLNEKYPFLEYACLHIFFHADEAARKIAQTSFLTTFRLRDWITLSNVFEKFKVRRYTPNASLLYIFAEHDCGNLIRAIRQEYSLMDSEDERYRYPFFAALAAGSRDALKALIQHYDIESVVLEKIVSKLPAARHFRKTTSSSPFSWALVNDHPDLAELLLSSNDVRFPVDNDQRLLALNDAAAKGYDKIVKLIIERSPSHGEKGKLLRRAMISAAENGQLQVAEIALYLGAHLDKGVFDRAAALTSAAWGGYHAVVSLLLRRGFDAEIRDKGRTAILCAAVQGHTAIVALLLDQKACIEARDPNGNTALMSATRSGHVTTVKLLLDRGADIEAIGGIRGSTALILAATGGKHQVVHTLLDHGADPHLSNSDGGTALMWAASSGCVITTEMLMAKGADLEARDNRGRTALFYAVEHYQPATAELLIANNANPGVGASKVGIFLSTVLGKGISLFRLRSFESPFAQMTCYRDPREWLRSFRSFMKPEERDRMSSRAQVVKLLLSRNELPDGWRDQGDCKTALEWALDEEGDWAIELLLAKSRVPLRVEGIEVQFENTQ